MPKIKNHIKITYADRILFCFVTGIMIGTILFNLFGGQIQDQSGYFESIFQAGVRISRSQQKQLLYAVVRQRYLETGVAWLISLTVFSIPCFYGLSCYAGVSFSILLCLFTCQRGIYGLPLYVCSLLPHMLFYIPVWCVLAHWAGQPKGKLRLPTVIGLMMAIGMGTILEVYVNPVITAMLI